jgi:hypothetical protein
LRRTCSGSSSTVPSSTRRTQSRRFAGGNWFVVLGLRSVIELSEPVRVPEKGQMMAASSVSRSRWNWKSRA